MTEPTTDHPHGSRYVEIALDAQGVVLSVDAPPASKRLADEIAVGESLDALIHTHDRDFFFWCAQWILAGQDRRQTIRLRWSRLGGWMEANATLSSDGDGAFTVVLRPDELELARRTESELRRVVEGSAQGIVVRTNERVLYTNEAFAHLQGFASTREMTVHFNAEEKAGRNRNQSGAVHPDDRALVTEHMRRRIAGEETTSHYEFRLLRRDGTPVWVETHASLARWNGQPASLSWMTDISQRKQIEEELIKSKEAAEFANRTKTEFLANMSHELRTPLNAIIGFAEVMKDELFGPVGTRKYVGYAKDIYNSGRHLLDLINDILDLSKLEVGKLELREEDVVLPRMIEECVALMRNRAEKSDVHLTTDLAPHATKLHCDERALRQVLLNLLSNAVKFTPPGGTVAVRVRRVEDGLALAVSDTGIGMSEEDISVALSPFGQIDSAIAREHKGTGLGLPISKQLIELHGGTLTITSEVGLGTTMTATFPLSRIVSSAVAA